MQSYVKAALAVFISVLLFSCSDEGDYAAYFGGQVINPTVNYVVFSKGNKVIDTLRLDKANRFFIKFDSLTPGLYTFKCAPDYQYVYFEKNDSIMVSIDPSDFDQSIVFSGRGDKKNNFMMELYLQHEADRKSGYNVYDYGYDVFTKKIDSTYAKRKDFYNKSKAEIQWGDDFDFYASSRVNLNYYTKKEYYPYLHARRTGENVVTKLPADYYSFRKQLHFDDPKMIYYSPYVRYLTAMVNNMAITNGFKKAGLQEEQLRDNIKKLNVIDSMFSNETVKNEMLNNIAFTYLLEDQNIINNQRFLERYVELSTDDNKDNEIRKIADAVKLLKEGNKLPSAQLETLDGKTFDISKGLGKETVVFFWTSCARAQLEAFYERVNSLQSIYGNVEFVSINVDEAPEWKKRVSQFEDSRIKQLRAKNFEELKDKWVITKISRTIVLNPDGTIKNAFTNLMDPAFGNELKK